MLDATTVAGTSTKRTSVNVEVGVWIDHQQAIVVILNDDGVKMRCVESVVENRARRSEGLPANVRYGRGLNPVDNLRQKEYTRRIANYYDKVISAIDAASAIYIFGPDEAKGELRTRIGQIHPNSWTTLQAAAKITQSQIVTTVRRFFNHKVAGSSI
jgi:hypothetical protein